MTITDEIAAEANIENIPRVIEFTEKHLEEAQCPAKTVMHIAVAIDEIFSNIARYAYDTNTGDVKVILDILKPDINEAGSGEVTITFIDSGKPYNPLKKEDPDITLPADERKIGGLGIFMVKKSMDEMTYSYEGGKNILSIKKAWAR